MNTINQKTTPIPLTVYKASAGSGKTFTLATEYIKLLIRNPLNYRQILAVTFTNKATEEMKMRILSQLYGIWRELPDSKSYQEKVSEALKGELSPQQIAERAGQALHLLLHNYSYFHVETIDSFFQSVMRNLARELNLTANLRVGLNDVQMEEAAVDQLIDSLSATDLMLQWLMTYIMDNISDDRSWNVIGQIKKFGRTIFRDYYKAHSQELTALMQKKDFFSDYQEELRRMRSEAMKRMQDIGNAFFAVLEDEGLDISDLSYGNTGVASLFVKLRNGVFDESVLTSRALDCNGQPEKWCKKNHQRRDLIYHLASTSLGSLLSQAIEEQPRQWKLYKSADLTLRHLSQLRLLGNIEQKMRQLNDEQNRFLLSDTQQLLHELIDGSDTPFIFEKIGTHLEHIMIDEFQDTSTVQWQNFKILLQETMSHKGSENLIVGDVKQSIYRWRSGDWRLLAGITDEFPNAQQMVYVDTLDTNRRSAPSIVNFNNAFFIEAAKQEEVTAYGDVKQKVPDGKPCEGQVSVTLFPAADYESKTLTALTTQIEELLSEGAKASDIAILVRTNSYIPLIAKHLNEQLPDLKVVSDEAFRLDASSAVMAIVTALRHLSHPDDAIAKASLEEIHSSTPEQFFAEDAILALLQLPLYELTEQLYSLLQLDRMGNQSAYLCAFFDQVTTYAADNGSDIDGFLREWDESIGAKTIQSPETDGLRIISIHKSKGLEFHHVLVPFCDWRLEMPDVLWCTPGEAPFNRLPLAPIDFSQKGMKGTIYDSNYKEEHQQNIVDNLNLLYVAFTRASKRLYVYGKRKSTALSRSALIEKVLPEITEGLDGASLTGQEDESAPIVFTYKPQAANPKPQASSLKSQTSNPFLQESTPVKVGIETFDTKVNFKQSKKSIEFSKPDADEDEQSLQMQYIQLGSVMHSVLSSIRSTDDVDSVLQQLEQEGILYDGELTRPHLLDLLRKRLSSPRVAEWFKPGRWQLFNECTILSIDPKSGRVVEHRPDRVMADGKQTIVVDFKFGREREEYHKQVRNYMQLLSDMGHQNVTGYLWLVYSNKIIEVKPTDLTNLSAHPNPSPREGLSYQLPSVGEEPMMGSHEGFLSYVADDILSKYGNDLSRVAVVFPNKRASLFLNELLARKAGRPIWSPAYITISELFRQHSERQVADPIKLVCDLHKSFTAQTGIDETLDHFYGWGQLLLADFDDLDKQMADADRVLANLSDLHEMDDDSFLTDEQRQVLRRFFSNFSDEHNSELKQRFLRLWNRMGAIYHDFNQRLAEQGLAYEGSLYKEVVTAPGINFAYDNYIFVGFNVLLQVEQRLFTLLRREGKARFYWDFDRYYMKDNETGHFISQYQADFPNELDIDDEHIYNNFAQPKHISIVSASTENIQARYAAQWLKGHEATSSTAVVLCNEGLLPAITHCLPDNVDNVNITTGYPLSLSPVASLVNQLVTLRRDGYDHQREHFRLRQVSALLRHPYLMSASPQVSALLKQLREEKNYFPTRQQLQVDELTTQLFRPFAPQHQNGELLSWLCDVLQLVATSFSTLHSALNAQHSTLNIQEDVLLQECIFRAWMLLNRLQNLAESGDLITDSITLGRLINQLMQTTTVPFHGEPAEGLQVMGLLETRNLDFRHLLILSASEGNMPRGASDTSFIPYSLRKAYGLTTPDHQVAIYSYYFHRLLQRADDVTIVYNNSTADGQKGEMSRFLLQLMVECPHRINYLTLQGGQDSQKRQPQAVENRAQLPELLTPTAINRYLRCPLQFHYYYVEKLREPDETDDDTIDNRIFGNIFHEASRIIYTRLMNQSHQILARDIDHLLKTKADIERAVDEAFRTELFQIRDDRPNFHPRLNGLQLINRQVIIHYLRQLLTIDRQLAPFTILDLEGLVSMELPLSGAKGPQKATIGGRIDRLDMITDRDGRQHIRVIDYKTGAHRLKPLADVEAIFAQESLKNHSDYYLQTMLYSIIVAREHPQTPVSPALLFIQHAQGDDYDPILQLGKQQPISDVSELAPLFMQLLSETIERMFDPDTPLEPTTDQQRCVNCPYRQLCFGQ